VSEKAAAWVDCVIAYGAVLLILLMQDWSTATRPRIAIILAAAFVSACIKVRVPAISGSYSLSFIVVLVAMTTCTLHETVLIAAVAAVVQTGWSGVTPTSRHFLFNGSVLLASVTAGHAVYHSLSTGIFAHHYAAALAATAAVYWLVNTGLVSVTLALLGEGSTVGVWRRWAVWTLPYYVAGTAVAGALSPSGNTSWESAVALIVAAIAGYCCWGIAVEGRKFLLPPWAAERSS
jgi:hypothetical protein